MNKAFKLVVALLISFQGLAQNGDSTKWNRFKNQFDNPYKNFEAFNLLGFQSSTFISTNRISNDFIYPFVFGKKLEKDAIDHNLENTKNKRLSSETNQELRFVNLKKNAFKTKSLNWYVKGGVHSRTFVNATNDAAKLIFKGNTETSKYEFNDCSYSNLRLNKFGGGLYHHVEKTAKPFNLTFGLFIIQALNYGNVKTYNKNYLQGNEDSFDIGVNYDAAFANAKAFSSNGLGLGSEVVFNQKISPTKTWGFSLQNFGFAYFKNNTTTYTANGQYKFDGIYIAEVGRLSEDDYFKNKLDSFTNPLNNVKENQSKPILIAPVSFIYYNMRLNGGYYQLGLRNSGTKALPTAEFRYFTFIKPSFILGVSAGVVGQNYLNTDISWAISKQWFFQAGLYHLEALALPKTFGGLGGSYGLQFVF
jgi:hypothetical protein